MTSDDDVVSQAAAAGLSTSKKPVNDCRHHHRSTSTDDINGFRYHHKVLMIDGWKNESACLCLEAKKLSAQQLKNFFSTF